MKKMEYHDYVNYHCWGNVGHTLFLLYSSFFGDDFDFFVIRFGNEGFGSFFFALWRFLLVEELIGDTGNINAGDGQSSRGRDRIRLIDSSQWHTVDFEWTYI